MKKPFALFSGQAYYPAPGWTDYDGDYETLAEAIKVGKRKCESSYEWWQVVDLNRKIIVAGEGEGYTGLFSKFPAFPDEKEE